MVICMLTAIRLILTWIMSFFFFQAEDGIRDADVTGVQTCALPIWQPGTRCCLSLPDQAGEWCAHLESRCRCDTAWRAAGCARQHPGLCRAGALTRWTEIGRASCRERVWSSRVAGAFKKQVT